MTHEGCVAVLQAADLPLVQWDEQGGRFEAAVGEGRVWAIYRPLAAAADRLVLGYDGPAPPERIWLLPRAAFAGWIPAGQAEAVATGEPDFDGRFIALCDPPVAVARLNEAVRGAFTHLAALGARIWPEGVRLAGPAVAAAGVAPLQAAVAALRVVAEGWARSDFGQVLLDARRDPAPGVRAAAGPYAAWATAALGADTGMLTALALVSDRHGLEPEQQPASPEESVAWIQSTLAESAPDDRTVDAWLLDAQAALPDEAAEVARAGLVDRLLARLTAGQSLAAGGVLEIAQGSVPCARALYQAASERGVSQLLPLARGDAQVVDSVASARLRYLGALGAAEDLPTLQQVRRCSDVVASKAAEDGLVALVLRILQGPDGAAIHGPVKALLVDGGTVAGRLVEALHRLGPAAPDGLGAVLAAAFAQAPSGPLAYAIEALGDPSATDGLIQALAGDGAVRAAQALGAVGASHAVGPLREHTGLFTGGELKQAARAAIAAIEARSAARGGLSLSRGEGGGLTAVEP